jgi:hypothetical protein
LPEWKVMQDKGVMPLAAAPIRFTPSGNAGRGFGFGITFLGDSEF